MRNIARIEPIINLLVSSWKFEAELLDWWKKRPDLRLSQYLINEWIIEEDRNIYNFYDECWITMEKLWFQWRDFAIRGWYGKDWKWELEYKIIKDMDDDHISKVLEHMISSNALLDEIDDVTYWIRKWDAKKKFSENQINKFKWEKMLRDIANLPDKTLIRLDWRWPCLTTKIPWEFRDYYSDDLFKPRNPDSYEIITKEEAIKEIEEALDSIHWS